MSLNFPADPVANPIYEAPNGVTYIWNGSIQSWVVQSVEYDSEYVNITGDTMTGELNFATLSSPIGIWWGGNPKLAFMTGGETELRGRYNATGPLTISTPEGINFTHSDSVIKYKSSRRLVFTDNYTHMAYGGTMYLSFTANGVQYHGHFTQPKNVTTVEYVTNEIDNIQTQIDLLNYDLSGNITDVINDKAVLVEGDQSASGIKTFSTQVRIDRGEDVGNGAVNSFIIKGKVGSNNQYGVLLKDYRRPDGDEQNDSVLYYGSTSGENNIVNKKYVTNNTLKSVSGTSGQSDDSGIRTESKSDGNQKIYAMKASISQYGVNVRGLLPQGNNNPSNTQLRVGQMYFNTNTKRVFIRVNLYVS